MMEKKDLKTYAENTWCPGCGNFGILNALTESLKGLNEEDGLGPERFVLASGIGCHAKIVDYVNVNSFYSIHGRVAPAISGIKLANPQLVVIGHAGDGDAYGEGLAHLIFAAKRNINVTFIVHDNRVYGLTTGQFTPTSPAGFKGRSTPKGSPEDPFNPVELLISAGATFVARGYAAHLEQLTALIKAAVRHPGFSFIDVLQPCFTFFNTYKFYNERVYSLVDDAHDPKDLDAAIEKAREWSYGVDGKIATGIFYQVQKPAYEERLLRGRIPVKMDAGALESVLRAHI